MEARLPQSLMEQERRKGPEVTYVHGRLRTYLSVVGNCTSRWHSVADSGAVRARGCCKHLPPADEAGPRGGGGGGVGQLLIY